MKRFIHWLLGDAQALLRQIELVNRTTRKSTEARRHALSLWVQVESRGKRTR